MLLTMLSNGSIGNQVSPEGDGDPPDQRNHPIEQSMICRTSTESCCAEQLRVEVRRDEKVSLFDACIRKECSMLSVQPKLQLISFSGIVGTISRTDAACAVLLRQLTLDETLCALCRCQTFFLAFDFECDLGLGLVFLFQPGR